MGVGLTTLRREGIEIKDLRSLATSLFNATFLRESVVNAFGTFCDLSIGWRSIGNVYTLISAMILMVFTTPIVAYSFCSNWSGRWVVMVVSQTFY